MWSAIKSELFEFVATVQEDCHDTISKVVDINAPQTDDEEEKVTEDERILSEFRNKFSTYSEVTVFYFIVCHKSGCIDFITVVYIGCWK